MRTFKLNPTSRRYAVECVQSAPDGYIVRVGEDTRTLDQNAKLWPMLHDLSRQVVWYGARLTDDEWKDVLTAGLKKSKVVPGIDGGFVVCGQSTSKMSKATFSELIELIYAFGSQHNVQWSELSRSNFAEFA